MYSRAQMRNLLQFCRYLTYVSDIESGYAIVRRPRKISTLRIGWQLFSTMVAFVDRGVAAFRPEDVDTVGIMRRRLTSCFSVSNLLS